MQTDLAAPLLPRSSSDTPEPLRQGPGDPVIGIIGSGDFSRSLAIRLVACGLRVVVGSRRPNRVARGLFPDGVELLSQKEAADGAGRVVFVAVYPEHYGTLLGLRERLAGKVLVDVSNATRLKSGERSNAETLAELFPESRVVKAFNMVSAWTLQAGVHDGNRQVRPLKGTASWRNYFTQEEAGGKTRVASSPAGLAQLAQPFVLPVRCVKESSPSMNLFAKRK